MTHTGIMANMTIGELRGKITLVLGDMAILLGGLWVALFLRFQTVPTLDSFFVHVQYFVILLFAWVVVLYISGLYDRFAFDFKKRIFSILIRAQIANTFIAVMYFYLLSTAIAPKTILFLYVIVVTALLLVWRLVAFPLMYQPRKARAIIVCAGKPLVELVGALQDGRHGIMTVATHDLSAGILDPQKLFREIQEKNIEMVIFDYQHSHAQEMIAHLYPLIFKGMQFVQFETLYERVFSRISVEHLSPEWFSQNTSAKQAYSYFIVKRIIDIIIALPLLVVSAVFFPLVAFAIKIDSAGDALIYQERIGKNGKIIRIPKFRSMTTNDQGVWVNTEGDARITRVGAFLRKTRIDELPQLWSVIKGDLSLVGPRPDIIGLGRELEQTVPYYTVRNLVAPGLSGWAQISQDKPPQSLEETILRLSYDLYYIKHRSLSLDLEIALKTVRILLSRTGS